MQRREKPIGMARSLRKRAAPAETLLWKAIRNRALGGFKFRRQHPVGPYVLDFACQECKVAVELDGLSHLRTKENDKARTLFLEELGWRVIRFWNTEIYDDYDQVLEAIYRKCVACTEAEPA